LSRPGRKTKTGTRLFFGNNELTAVVREVTDSGNRLIEFNYSGGIFIEVLERLGKTPLPPYIHEELEDSERYQTVYSRVSGSAAAPTAGLHFTNELLEKIKTRGVALCYLTLHVGLGTFRPVKTNVLEEHHMHAEFFSIPEETAETINRTKAGGGRVIAVGTTSCRSLEASAGKFGIRNSEFGIEEAGANRARVSSMQPKDSKPCRDMKSPDALAEGNSIKACSGFTDIFIYPGYEFKIIDGLITNFHLPESTLIMLISAFAGRENVLRAYNEAIRERYRFFSFGDAMLIL